MQMDHRLIDANKLIEAIEQDGYVVAFSGKISDNVIELINSQPTVHRIFTGKPSTHGAMTHDSQPNVSRLTQEEQRYIELGKAVEAVFDEFEMVDLSGVDTETMKSVSFTNPYGIIAWHRAEVDKE